MVTDRPMVITGKPTESRHQATRATCDHSFPKLVAHNPQSELTPQIVA